jgi:acyl-coenzyme A synthetase/AMP-(fatty) acid ligase
VVLRRGAAAGADELRRHCAESLARYKVPKRFEFVSELPRTDSGKLLRQALR